MKVRVYFKKIVEGDVVIDVSDSTQSCDFAEVAEKEHAEADLYCGSEKFEMTDYELED